MTQTRVLTVNDDLPIRSDRPAHSGKVRSVYWLNAEDSARLIREKNYAVAPDAELAIMIISDRISAFDCIWHGEHGLQGVPGKGAALNAISHHWFSVFREQGLARSHILEVPHPLVWIVQKARPILIEAIGRQYITGSLWRAYERGAREFCGQRLPEGLEKNQGLHELLITPSTKGILRGIPGVPEADDANISRANIEQHYRHFQFQSTEDIDRYEALLREGFALISRKLAALDQIFVDTKFEFGYAKNADGEDELIYMDEVGTPDSSRIWDGEDYRQGRIVEKSKEVFRQSLLQYFPDPDILLNSDRMNERKALARDNPLPEAIMHTVAETYAALAEKITGKALSIPEDPRAEILAVLGAEFDLLR